MPAAGTAESARWLGCQLVGWDVMAARIAAAIASVPHLPERGLDLTDYPVQGGHMPVVLEPTGLLNQRRPLAASARLEFKMSSREAIIPVGSITPPSPMFITGSPHATDPDPTLAQREHCAARGARSAGHHLSSWPLSFQRPTRSRKGANHHSTASSREDPRTTPVLSCSQIWCSWRTCASVLPSRFHIVGRLQGMSMLFWPAL